MSRGPRTNAEIRAMLDVFDVAIAAIVDEKAGLDMAISRRQSLSDDVWVRQAVLVEQEIRMRHRRSSLEGTLLGGGDDTELLRQFAFWLDSKLVHVTPYEGEPTNASNLLEAYLKERDGQ